MNNVRKYRSFSDIARYTDVHINCHEMLIYREQPTTTSDCRGSPEEMRWCDGVCGPVVWCGVR